MLRLRDAKVVVGIIRLKDTVGGRGGADGEDGGGAVGSLSLSDFGDGGH